MIVALPFFSNRGSPILVYNYLKPLVEIGYKIDILTYPEGKDIKVENVRIKRIPKLFFLKDTPIGMSINKLIYDFILLIYGIYYGIKKDYEIVHGQHADGALIGFFIKKLKKIKLYYTVHSLVSEEMKIRKSRGYKILSKFYDCIENLLYKNADKMFLVSPSFKKRIAEFGYENKAFFIPDVSEINKIDEELNRELAKFRDKIIITYAGNLEAYQGIDLLLESFALVEKEDGMLFIVGGIRKDVDRYKKFAERLGIKNVRFFGQQSFDKIHTYLSNSDILITCRLEGGNIPSKLFTYLCYGKPIIATNITAHNIVLENNKNALMCDLNKKDIAEKINLLLKEKELRIKLGNEAKKLHEEKYNRGIYKKILKELY